MSLATETTAPACVARRPRRAVRTFVTCLHEAGARPRRALVSAGVPWCPREGAISPSANDRAGEGSMSNITLHMATDAAPRTGPGELVSPWRYIALLAAGASCRRSATLFAGDLIRREARDDRRSGR